MKYYVQVIAANYLNNVVDEPQTMVIHPSYLHGINQWQFQEGYMALHGLILSLYSDIVEDPSGFGMLLKENIIPNAKNADYTNSNASLIRVPNLLLIIGAKGVLQSDMALSLNREKLLASAKELKITGLPLLLNKLCEYGFTIEGFDNTGQDNNNVHISFPNNRYLIVALKAMADALMQLNKYDLSKPKTYFYILHNGLLENNPVKAPKLTVESIYHSLDSEKRKVAAALDEAVASYSKTAVRMGGLMRNDWSCVYMEKKNKKVIMSLQVEQDTLSAKFNLQHIGNYINLIMDYPENIREAIRSSGWECGHCRGNCAGGFAFKMESKSYNKCRCGSFVFENISFAQIPYCKELIAQEMSHLDS